MAGYEKYASQCKADCCCKKAPKQFSGNMLTALQQVKDETDWRTEIEGFSRQKYWDKHSSLMTLLHKEIGKLSVMYTTSPLPKCTEEEKLFDGITQCVLALVSGLYHLPLQQGQSLFRQWHRFTISLFSALHEFSKSLWNPNQQNIIHYTGVIWELCSSVNELPKDSQQCLIQQQKQVLSLVEDAFSELEQAKSSYCSGSNAEEEGPPIGEYDLSVLVAGLGLVKTAKMFLNKSVKSIQSNGHADTNKHIVDSDVFVELLSTTSEHVDDFAASLYPPSDREEVKDSLTSLTNHLTSLLDTFRQSHFCVETDTQWTTVFENAIKHNNDKVSALVS